LRAFIYALQTALKSVWLDKWINLLTIMSISIGLLILGAFATATLNVDSVLQRWTKSFGLVVYLDKDISTKNEQKLKDAFSTDPDMSNVKFISKDQALKELRQTLGSDASLIDEIGGNPLPSSFELSLKRELLKPEIVEKKAKKIMQMTGVEEVQYGEKWLSSLYTVARVLKLSILVFGCFILIAIIFITYSTIKIFFYRRKEEIETLKLLGATRGFIRMPFLLEGLFIGIICGTASALSLYGFNYLVATKIPEFLPSIKSVIVTLPVEAYIIVAFVGALMSLFGSLIAVGKIRY
jgi:cell division transport system permease protein